MYGLVNRAVKDLVINTAGKEAGLAPMLMERLDGLTEQLGESWYFEHVQFKESLGYDVFELTRASEQKNRPSA